jgi:phosphopantothenoylcysteine decarboxylase/phosphopantothenate--cysteine ligase
MVLLGVTGSIAAYKAAEIARALIRGGVRVRVVMTPAAERFVTPLTFEALTGSPVLTERSASGPEISHIAVAREAAALLIAPATAHTIAKMALGLADNLLSEIALATTTPVFVAPAMNVEMYRHPATQANIATLRARGVTVFDPAEGDLACGETGVGRLADPERIAQGVLRAIADRGSGRESFFVMAGPTREPIDPVGSSATARPAGWDTRSPRAGPAPASASSRGR